jgi:hypothetical protein
MRGAVHFGLALALVLAPSLCCCQLRAAHSAPRDCCAPVEVPPAPHSCCSLKHSKPTEPKSDRAPRPAPESCACCAERPPAAPVEGAPAVPSAEPTGELLPHAARFVLGPEHTAPERAARAPGAGADAKSEALFARHAMRC